MYCLKYREGENTNDTPSDTAYEAWDINQNN